MSSVPHPLAIHVVSVPRGDGGDARVLPHHGDDDGHNHNRIHRRHHHGDDGDHGDARGHVLPRDDGGHIRNHIHLHGDGGHDDVHALPRDDGGRSRSHIHTRHHGDAHDVRVILSPYPSYIYPPAYCFNN